MSNDCSRCGTPTESPYVTTTGSLGFDGWLCDSCREAFAEWVDAGGLSGDPDPDCPFCADGPCSLHADDGDEQQAVLGACHTCGGQVEVSFRYMGHGVQVVAECSTCGWTQDVNK